MTKHLTADSETELEEKIAATFANFPPAGYGTIVTEHDRRAHTATVWHADSCD